MNINKAEPAEDQREISLNETSVKRPLDVLDVIGGHGPWQFRQWLVFFVASFCNATVLFSPLFLPSKTFCNLQNSPALRSSISSIINSTTPTSKVNLQNGDNQSFYLPNNCSSSDCVSLISDISLSYFYRDVQCSGSQIEIFSKCIYLVSCVLSGVAVYVTTTRFGRRHLSLTSCLFLIASSLATSWADFASAYLILRCIISLAVVNIYLISALSVIEYVYKDYKIIYFLTGHLGWGMACLFLPAVASIAKDWKCFNITLTIAFCSLFFFVWWGPESPSLSVIGSGGNRSIRSRKALKYAAFTNGYSTTDVDLLPHDFPLRPEKENPLATAMSSKQKSLWIIYSCILFLMCFLTTFLYFSAKWNPEWFKVARGKVSFSFLSTTEIAGCIVLLFLTCIVAAKHLWAFVSLMTSTLMIVIYSRNKPDTSTSSAMIYTVTMFFAAASWTLLLTKVFCHKIKKNVATCSLTLTVSAMIAGALTASVITLKASHQILLLVFGVPHLLIAALSAFLLSDEFFGTVS